MTEVSGPTLLQVGAVDPPPPEEVPPPTPPVGQFDFETYATLALAVEKEVLLAAPIPYMMQHMAP